MHLNWELIDIYSPHHLSAPAHLEAGPPRADPSRYVIRPIPYLVEHTMC